MVKVCIDVGHGGRESGAVSIPSPVRMLEKKINFNVAMKLHDLLESQGFKVVMTREADKTVSFSERGRTANEFKSDIVISIHHNAGGGKGYDLIHNLHKPLSKTVALAIGKEFDKLGQTKHKIFVRESLKYPDHDYYGIMTACNAPVVITEYAFLDTVDVKDIDTLTEQWGEAKAICDALISVFGKQK